MRRLTFNILSRVHSTAFLRVAVLAMLGVAFSATAKAQCGDSLTALAAGATFVRSQSQVSQPSFHSDSAFNDHAVNKESTLLDDNSNGSIVGLWHIRFLVGDQTIQEAFQIWNTGGTEVHNPNVDPRSGSVCLGAWKEGGHRTFKLIHRVWRYDTNGNFMGTINLTEFLVLGADGNTHRGSFTLDFYDPSGNFQFQVPGNVIAERIPAQ